MIIGLTGKNAAGKGEVAKVLTEGGFLYLSLSDMLREELQRRSLEPTRENLIQVGTEIRRLYGGGVLADRALQKIDIDKNYIVDSIRNPREVEVLRRLPNFRLIHVTALPETRFSRIRSRARAGDPETLDAFIDFEAREAKSADPNAQQLEETAHLADLEVANDIDLQLLQSEVKQLVLELAKKNSRPGWDDYFMGIARVVSLRSNCLKRKVAAVIIKDKRIISTGYNGTPRGVLNCNEGGCPRCGNFEKSGVGLGECFCSHAEENSIVQAAYHGVSIHSSILYTTFSPCLMCTKMIINSGIAEVVFNAQYPLGEQSIHLLMSAGVKVRQIEIGNGENK